jgi:hypothetical protein
MDLLDTSTRNTAEADFTPRIIPYHPMAMAEEVDRVV